MTDVDTKLKSLFAAPPTAPDEMFIKRVDCAVMAEQKMRAAQAAMWRRFAVEFAGTVAVIAAFYLLWKMAPGEIAINSLIPAPALAASMILFIWLAVQAKHSAKAR